MTVTKKEINQIITTAFAVGYNARRTAVLTSPLEEARDKYMNIVLGGMLVTYHCPKVSKEAFCIGCEHCINKRAESSQEEDSTRYLEPLRD